MAASNAAAAIASMGWVGAMLWHGAVAGTSGRRKKSATLLQTL
jgi:hypothetical protein